MDYTRNRNRINQLRNIGLTQQSVGFIKNGYFVSNHNVKYLTDEAWGILIDQIVKNVAKSDDKLFLVYIQKLNSIKAPELQDARLSEMVAIIDNVIKEFTVYVNEELTEPKTA